MSEATFGDRLDRWLLKRGFRAQWPLATLRCIEARRAATQPLAQLKRRSAMRAVTFGSRWADFIDRRTGYRLFTPDAFPELAHVTQACREIFATHADEVTDTEVYNKRYFFNILSEDDLRRHRVLAEFALSPPVTEAVTAYLGMVPRFHSLGVFYSSINDTISGSQMYHVDGDALSQVKCFVNIWDVDRGSGAFSFVPKHLTSTQLRHGGLVKTLSDEDVERATPSGSLVEVVGAPGSGVFVDTSRCLHQGSRARERPRLVFQFQYVSRPDALLARAPGKLVPGGHLLVTRRLIESLGLVDKRVLSFIE